jgi:hypothetical protein
MASTSKVPDKRREYHKLKMRESRARQRVADPAGFRQKEWAAVKRWRSTHAARFREYMRLLMRVGRAKGKIAKLLAKGVQDGR